MNKILMDDPYSAVVRLTKSTSELDQAESEWWEKFAEVEERFCWVQSWAIQQYLRGDYLRGIVRLASGHKRIADLGCGTGWLTILLAKMGAERVVGIDYSETQIRRAIERAKDARVDDRVTFCVANAENPSKNLESFDIVLLHGLLHHLSVEEIQQTLQRAREMLNKNGCLLVMEPVIHDSSRPHPEAQWLLGILRWLQSVPLRGKRCGLRKFSTEEIRFRSIIGERAVGKPPRGPSPKEMPFRLEELRELLKPSFRIRTQKRLMAVTHLIAQEILLMELSHPFLATLIRWPLLALARFLERWFLSLDSFPSGVWIFEMFECIPKNAEDLDAS